MPNPDDKLTDIPRLVPERDEITPRGRADSTDARRPARAAKPADDASAPVSGSLRFMAAAGFFIAILAVAGAGFLYQQNVALGSALEQATLRIVDLEGKLSSTDDSVNQTSTQMQVKLKDLGAEVDKLWAASKKNGARIEDVAAAQKKGDAEVSRQIAALKSGQTTLAEQMAPLPEAVAAMKEQQASQQSVITRLASTTTSLSSTQRAQEDRIKETEQWVQSTNQFRKQVMQRLTRLENPPSALPKE